MEKQFTDYKEERLRCLQIIVEGAHSCIKLEHCSNTTTMCTCLICGDWRFIRNLFHCFKSCRLHGRMDGSREYLIPARRLRVGMTNESINVSRIFHLWPVGHQPFDKLESDNIIFFSSSRNMLWTGDPEVINQIARQGTSFSFFDSYGLNMQTFTGKDRKSRRKLVEPAIVPRSNAAMWQAALAR